MRLKGSRAGNRFCIKTDIDKAGRPVHLLPREGEVSWRKKSAEHVFADRSHLKSTERWVRWDSAIVRNAAKSPAQTVTRYSILLPEAFAGLLARTRFRHLKFRTEMDGLPIFARFAEVRHRTPMPTTRSISCQPGCWTTIPDSGDMPLIST